MLTILLVTISSLIVGVVVHWYTRWATEDRWLKLLKDCMYDDAVWLPCEVYDDPRFQSSDDVGDIYGFRMVSDADE